MGLVYGYSIESVGRSLFLAKLTYKNIDKNFDLLTFGKKVIDKISSLKWVDCYINFWWIFLSCDDLKK